MEDVLAISKAATEAAQAATTASQAAQDAATAAREAATGAGINLPDEVIAKIAAASSGAFQNDLRAIGAIVEEGGDGAGAGAGVGDAAAQAAAAAAAASAAAGDALAAVAGSPDEIIFPTFAHRVSRQGVRRGDWEAGR
jgi:hypothetical protein